MKKVDLIGSRHGRLVVLSESGKDKWGKFKYACKCDCGATKDILGSQLRSGRTKSCGCLQKINSSLAHRKHGLRGTRVYRAWQTMRGNAVRKGIPIDPAWKDINKFIEDVGDIPSNKHVISRVSLDEGFIKGNTAWSLHNKRVDLTGKKFGRLTVLRKSKVNEHGQHKLACKCDCGNTCYVISNKLISGETKSCGCFKSDGLRKRMSQTKDEFISKASERHSSKYDYASVLYKGHDVKVSIICPEHGIFIQTPNVHLQTGGCPSCGIRNTALANSSTTEDFIKSAKRIHGDTFEYGLVRYVNAKAPVQITCHTHGAFLQTPNSHLNGNGCRKCNESKPEKEVADFIVSLGLFTTNNDRSVFSNSSKEADVYIPSKRMVIEYDGGIWHSERFAADKYNILEKSKLAWDIGLDCIHIREDQWLGHKRLVKSLLKSRLGIFDHRTGARTTIKKDITNEEYRNICSNHLQGFRPAAYKKGLFFKGELVAAIGYNKDGELVRYVVKNGWQVMGALPKLIKNEDIKYSFCDLSFFNGDSYPKAGFELEYTTKPNYRYVKGKKTVSRNSMMKHKLENVFSNFDANITEVQNCANNGWYRLFDCGNAKYVMPQD